MGAIREVARLGAPRAGCQTKTAPVAANSLQFRAVSADLGAYFWATIPSLRTPGRFQATLRSTS